MNKLVIIILLTIYSTELFSNEGLVLVLQAPLLKEPNLNSKVLQYVRNGEKIYISMVNINDREETPPFYETFDRAGNIAYIPSKYIKPITNDEKESWKSISYGESDPTDYRLEEPIPATYPFENYSHLKASFSVSLGNSLKSPYDYQKNFSTQNYDTEYGGRFLINKKVHFDKYDRIYFGALLIFSSFKNSYLFSDDTKSLENRSMIRVGPFISFDAFSGRDWRITIGSGFTYNYHKTSINIANVNEDIGEERFFTGFSLSPLISSYAQIENLFPAFDIIFGTDITLYPDHKLKATTSSEVPTLWNGNEIHEELKPQATLFLGAQFKY